MMAMRIAVVQGQDEADHSNVWVSLQYCDLLDLSLDNWNAHDIMACLHAQWISLANLSRELRWAPC